MSLYSDCLCVIGGIIMKFMKYNIMFVLLMFVFFIFGCTTDQTTQITNQSVTSNVVLDNNHIIQNTSKEITIGFTTPLTGNGADWGNDIRKGAELAYEEIQNQERNTKIKIIWEDTQCKPDVAVSVTQKLIDVDNVKFIAGEVCSGDTLAVAPILNSNKIVYLAAGSTNPRITDAGDYIFRVSPSDAFKGSIIADNIYTSGYSDIAILYVNNDFGKGIESVFRKEFEFKGGKVLISESYDPAAIDFKTNIAKILNSNASTVFIVVYPKENPIIYKQLREMKFDKQIFADGSAFVAKDMMLNVGHNADGVIYIYNKIDISDSFKVKYQQKFSQNATLLNAFGYDTIKLLADGIEYCNGDSECVKSYLYSVDYSGATGKIVFDKNGDVTRGTSMFKIVNGTIQTYD